MGAQETMAQDGPLTVSRTELMVDGRDDAFRDLLSNMFAFSQRLEEVRARFANFIGLSAAQYMILIVLDRLESKGHTGINQIASHLRYSGAFVTIEVNNLVKAGHIVKTQHPTDKRRVVLKVTAFGKDCLKKLAAFQTPVNDALFEPLDKEGFAVLRKLMNQLAANSSHALKIAEATEYQMNQLFR
jgi:DNA-binding MarR family transcriptional regulator